MLLSGTFKGFDVVRCKHKRGYVFPPQETYFPSRMSVRPSARPFVRYVTLVRDISSRTLCVEISIFSTTNIPI